MRVEFLWFSDCPNHESARRILQDALRAAGAGGGFDDIDATDPALAAELKFPGSPTIRVDGVDVEPGFEDPGDYTPRCRLYPTEQGLQGIPRREWIEAAIRSAATRQ